MMTLTPYTSETKQFPSELQRKRFFFSLKNVTFNQLVVSVFLCSNGHRFFVYFCHSSCCVSKISFHCIETLVTSSNIISSKLENIFSNISTGSTEICVSDFISGWSIVLEHCCSSVSLFLIVTLLLSLCTMSLKNSFKSLNCGPNRSDLCALDWNSDSPLGPEQ